MALPLNWLFRICFINYACILDMIVLCETFLDKSFELTKDFPAFEMCQTSAVKCTHGGRRCVGVEVLVK